MAREVSKAFYHSKQWQQVREYVLMRDSYLCRICGQPAEEVHHKIHLTPENLYDPRVNLNPDNLISLCRECHFKEHVADKIRGKNQKSRNFTDSYEFDETGQLVRKDPPL